MTEQHKISNHFLIFTIQNLLFIIDNEDPNLLQNILKDYENVNSHDIIEFLMIKANTDIAQQRVAVAKNRSGVVILRGQPSFSSDTQVLLDEIKFRLDNQLA